jgi:sigma-B regulation protein RsbU (phosphoserine phosphatase)
MMGVRYLGCTDAENALIREHPDLAEFQFEPIELPISGTFDPIEILVSGSLVEDPLSLAITVSDWNWPPVTLCLLREDTTEDSIREMRSHPQVGRSIFICRAAREKIEETVEAALDFRQERAKWHSAKASANSFTINNISPRWLFESMMRCLDEYIYFKDSESRFLAVSQYLVEQCGRAKPEEVLGKDDYDFFDTQHASDAYADEREIATGRVQKILKEEHLEEDGRESWVLSHKLPLYTRSNFVAGSFGISRDITKAKELQGAIEASNLQMKSELELARNLQKTLMERRLPSFKVGPEQKALTIATKYLASSQLSGDFYACRRTESGAAAFLVADVVGHGVRAAMITAMIQIAVQQLDHLTDEPEVFMRELNAMIHRSVKPLKEPIFATAIFVRLDLEDLSMSYVQAGARHGISITGASPRTANLLPSDAVDCALGLMPTSDYHMSTIRMSSGDEIFLYTDGLVEACNQDDKEFGEARLLEWLSGTSSSSWAIRFKDMITQLRDFTESEAIDDDICLLAVRIP